jgi:probable H4MPT-linked C1 transfer pathway protein
MTGELADCFATRSEGVAYIVDQLLQVVPPQQLSIYTVDGQWLKPQAAKADPWSVAASNWHALASWLAMWPATAPLFDSAVLVDIGSTTVDILPVQDHRLITPARTDRDRLELSQLVYTGLRRTPVCACLSHFVLGERHIPIMAEVFATVDDAYIWLGQVAEDPSDCDTADGRPRTRSCAASRLARMLGEDADRLNHLEIEQIATQILDAQALPVADAISRNLLHVGSPNTPPKLICSGHGLPLFDVAIRKVTQSYQHWLLSDFVAEEVSRCAPAAAVAWLLESPT